MRNFESPLQYFSIILMILIIENDDGRHRVSYGVFLLSWPYQKKEYPNAFYLMKASINVPPPTTAIAYPGNYQQLGSIAGLSLTHRINDISSNYSISARRCRFL